MGSNEEYMNQPDPRAWHLECHFTRGNLSLSQFSVCCTVSSKLWDRRTGAGTPVLWQLVLFPWDWPDVWDWLTLPCRPFFSVNVQEVWVPLKGFSILKNAVLFCVSVSGALGLLALRALLFWKWAVLSVGSFIPLSTAERSDLHITWCPVSKDFSLQETEGCECSVQHIQSGLLCLWLLPSPKCQI